MIENVAPKLSRRREFPFWVRACFVAILLTIVQGVFLGVTGYPVEEWPFVAGSFVVSLVFSSCLVNCLLLIVSKRLYEYGRHVLAERGVDYDAADAERAVPRTPRILLLGIFVLLIVGAVWGLALNLVVFFLERLAMPALGVELPLVAAVIFFVGVGGMTVTLSLIFALFYSVKRFEQYWVPASAVAHIVFNAVHGWQKTALFWRAGGIPLRAGTG